MIYRGPVLFLSNNDNSKSLYSWINEQVNAFFWDKRVDIDMISQISPYIVVSYNYNYIIPKEVIDYMNGNIINLHISFLPWNRGASPNLWSFLDGTPKGVTIHRIDEGLDKGRILFQKEMFFDEKEETLRTSYDKLNEEIVRLFKEHWVDIYNRTCDEIEPRGKGSYHSNSDLEKLQQMISFSWDDRVFDVIELYNVFSQNENRF